METGAEDYASRPLVFFPHDADAASDVKCRRLLIRCGMEGYGMWWRVCELLAASDGHRIPFQTEEDALMLAGELHLLEEVPDASVEQVSGFVATLEDVGLVRVEGGAIASERMDNNAEFFGKKRAAGSKGGANGSGKKKVRSKATGRLV